MHINDWVTIQVVGGSKGFRGICALRVPFSSFFVVFRFILNYSNFSLEDKTRQFFLNYPRQAVFLEHFDSSEERQTREFWKSIFDYIQRKFVMKKCLLWNFFSSRSSVRFYPCQEGMKRWKCPLSFNPFFLSIFLPVNFLCNVRQYFFHQSQIGFPKASNFGQPCLNTRFNFVK